MKNTEEDKIVYHVVTSKIFKVGQELIYNDSSKTGVYKRAMEKYDLAKDIYANPDKYEELDHHTKVALRELALEKLRQEKYSNYPSRLHSLYVSTNIDDSYMWANVFIKKDRPVTQIVKLKVKGKIFTGNAYNCFEGTKNELTNIELSYHYWNNDLTKEEPIYETLVDGLIEVVEIVKEYVKWTCFLLIKYIIRSIISMKCMNWRKYGKR